MPSVYRCQALKLPDSFSVFPELRGKNWVQGLVGEGERHRGADFVPHPNRQKDSAKDPGISGEASRPVLEPELRPEGRSSLRLGVRTGRRPAVGVPPPVRFSPICSLSTAGCVPQSTCCYHDPFRSSSCKGQCLETGAVSRTKNQG